MFLGCERLLYEPCTIADAKLLIAKWNDDIPIIFIDELPAPNLLNYIDFEIALYLRNLIRSLQLTCVLSGTESALINMINTATGSRGEKRLWVNLILNFPKPLFEELLPRKIIENAKSNEESLLSLPLYEASLLRRSRPLFIIWFIKCADEMCTISPTVLDNMKRCLLNEKQMFTSLNGVISQIMCVFTASYGRQGVVLIMQDAFNQEEYFVYPIRYHFGRLVSPASVDIYVSVDGDLVNEDYTRFKAATEFALPSEDELLYLVCFRNGIFMKVSESAKAIPSSYALQQWRNSMNSPKNDNVNTRKNDGHGKFITPPVVNVNHFNL